jgi:F-type H+-transporting ATPase subunit gamma
MAGLQDIRRRIRSVKNTQQVTKAMKMISAVKLRKSQERLTAMRPYASKMWEVVGRVVGRIAGSAEIVPGPVAQAFIAPREEKSIRLVVVASDKGLCGGFNANVLKAASAFLEEKRGDVVHLDVVGKRAADWARKRKLQAGGEHIALPAGSLARVAEGIATDAARQYQEGRIDALYVVYNYFHSPVSQVPKVVKLFPMEVDPVGTGVAEVAHLLEPDPNAVLETLLPRFVEVELLRCLQESSASEHGARMAAMDKASTNAGEMIAKLTLNMNKIRQASITNQIIEIVSGANA